MANNNAMNNNAMNNNAIDNNAIDLGYAPKYPSVKVQVPDAGGFNPTVSAVQAALRGAGIPLQELSTFFEDAAEGGEGNLLRTCMRWVDVEVG